MHSTDSTADASSFRILLLGPYQALVGGRPHVPRHSRKEQWLLALLTLRAGREVERSWIASTLWPESDKGRALLRDTLFDLRRSLGREAHRIVSPSARTLLLDLSGVEADVLGFDNAIAKADALSLRAAVSLYRGALLEGCDEAWVLSERSAREHAYLTARERLADWALEANDLEEAVGHLRQVLVTDPFRESACRALMEALIRQENYAAATQVYRELRLLLHRELHSEPASETYALYRTVQETQHRAATESRRQVTVASAPRSRSTTLPLRLTRFFGREEELARLTALLDRPGGDSAGNARAPRLVTIAGVGGCGKTRLALEISERLREQWNENVWFVPLAPLSEAARIPSAILEAMGLSPTPARDPLEQVCDALNAVAENSLLLLDNYEHLLAGETGTCDDAMQVIHALLEQVSTVTLLVTSRQVLNMEGEHIFALYPLPLPAVAANEKGRKRAITESGLTPETGSDLLQCPSVQLFMDRVRAKQYDFALTLDNASAIAELCVRLEGLPLALELAAARINAYSPQEMLEQFTPRFQLLMSRQRDVSERHRTMRDAIAWSYQLLSPDLQRFFASLSPFRGGWTVEAAASVCGSEIWSDAAPDVLLDRTRMALEQLQESSLLLIRQGEGERRFWMLETLREFGEERLSAEDRRLLLQRHREHYLALAERYREQMHGMDGPVWLNWLEADHENLRLALQGYRKEPEGRVSGLRMALALFRFWIGRFHDREAKEWIASFLESGTDVPPELQRRALNCLGNLEFRAGDHVRSLELFTKALALSREAGDRHQAAHALLHLGSIAVRERNGPQAREYLEECLAIYREVGDKDGLGNAYLQMGGAIGLCEGKSGIPFYEEAIRLHRELNSEVGGVLTRISLAYAMRSDGETERAEALLEECLALARTTPNLNALWAALNAVGGIAYEKKNYDRARECFEEAFALFNQQTQEYRWGAPIMLVGLGRTVLAQGDSERAARLLQEGLRTLRRHGDMSALRDGLEATMQLALAQMREAYAARLLGVLSARYPDQTVAYRDQLHGLQSAMQDSAWTTAEQAGRAMSLEEVLEYVLETVIPGCYA